MPEQKKKAGNHTPDESQRRQADAKAMYFTDVDVSAGTIASALQVNVHTVKGWINRYKWREEREKYLDLNADPTLVKANKINRKNSYKLYLLEIEEEEKLLNNPIRKPTRKEKDEAHKRVMVALQRMRQIGLSSQEVGVKLPPYIWG